MKGNNMSTRNSIKKQRPFALVRVKDDGYYFIRFFKTPKCLWHRAWVYMIAMSREYLYKHGFPKEIWGEFQAIPVNNFNCNLNAEEDYDYLEHIHIADDTEEDDAEYVKSLIEDAHFKNKPHIFY